MVTSSSVRVSLAALAICMIANEAAAQQVVLPPIGEAESVKGQDTPTRSDNLDDRSEGAIDPDAPSLLSGESDKEAVKLPQDKVRSSRGRSSSSGKPGNDGTIVVTGSRLQTGDVTSRVEVIDQADIRARGVTSVEELIRTLPQNVATIGAITNERSRGPLSSAERGAGAISPLGSLGVSAANLGGVGAGNTLVLVNGRRVAGAAGIEDGFVNLNGIPLSAIDRVEISQGASAVYGSDALGGVINFVLKRGYSGTTLTAQYENSANDADNARISMFSGKSWGSGNLSVTVDYARRHPVNNYRSGYTTEDYSSYYNNDAAFDRRSFSRGGQPGLIDRTAFVYNPATGIFGPVPAALTLPAGFTGVPRISDFITVGREALRDFVPELAGPRVESASASFNLDQRLHDRIVFFANGLYTRTKNTQEQAFDRGLTLNLAPGQAYNPFPAGYLVPSLAYTTVYYNPQAEVNSGDITPAGISNLAKQWNVSAGLRYEAGTNSKLELVYTTSQSSTRSNSTAFGSLVSFTRDTTSPTGIRCSNFQVENNRFPAEQRTYLRSVFDRQCRVLTSVDPTAAFNPFKSAATGGGSDLSPFIYRDTLEDRQSRLQNFELRWNSRLLALPAGGLYYAIGAEYNDDGVDSREVRVYTGDRVSRDRQGYFVETTIPIMGNGYDLPGIRTLTFNIAARRDVYDTEGAIGTVGGVSIDNGGEIIYGKNRFARTTPAFGIRWEPFSGLTLRGRWTRGFQAPPYTQLFSLTGTTAQQTIIFNSVDTIYQCTADCTFGVGANRGYFVPRRTLANPDLKPQTSRQEVFSAAWTPGGVLRGLNLAVSYSRNRIFNQYADPSDLARFLPLSQQYQVAQFYPRDATGKITAYNAMIFNLSGSEFVSTTYEGSYRFKTGIGTFEPRIVVLDNITARTTPFRNGKTYSQIGTISGVDRYKVVGSLNWQNGDFAANLFAYHTPSYVNDYIQNITGGNVTNPTYLKPVEAYTTIDLTASWQLRSNLRLDLAGRNIFDAAPPFVVVETRPYDSARYNAAGRTVSLQMQYSF